MSNTYLFLDAVPSTLQGTHTINEADETRPALDTSSGPDDTAGDPAGEDTTGEDGEDTLEGHAEDDPDNIDDGAKADHIKDTPDDPADRNVLTVRIAGEIQRLLISFYCEPYCHAVHVPHIVLLPVGQPLRGFSGSLAVNDFFISPTQCSPH